MTSVVLRPGKVALEEWHAVYRQRALTVDPSCKDAIRRGADAVERIVAKGEPVYGVNTGFGKLASVRIATADLESLQRNIVLSHAAGAGEATPEPIVRLMMALKLASLAQGASGVRPATVAMIEALLQSDLIPIVPAQGSVGASGDLAPLAHMAAAMIGEGEMLVAGLRSAGRQTALAEAGLEPAETGAEGRASSAERHPVFHRVCAGGTFRSGKPVSIWPGRRCIIDRGGQGFRYSVRRAHPQAAWPPRPDRVRRNDTSAHGWF